MWFVSDLRATVRLARTEVHRCAHMGGHLVFVQSRRHGLDDGINEEALGF